MHEQTNVGSRKGVVMHALARGRTDMAQYPSLVASTACTYRGQIYVLLVLVVLCATGCWWNSWPGAAAHPFRLYLCRAPNIDARVDDKPRIPSQFYRVRTRRLGSPHAVPPPPPPALPDPPPHSYYTLYEQRYYISHRAQYYSMHGMLNTNVYTRLHSTWDNAQCPIETHLTVEDRRSRQL